MDFSYEVMKVGLLLIGAIALTAGVAWHSRDTFKQYPKASVILLLGCAALIGIPGLAGAKLTGELRPSDLMLGGTAALVLGMLATSKSLLQIARDAVPWVREWRLRRRDPVLRRRFHVLKSYERPLSLIADPANKDAVRRLSVAVATVLVEMPDEDIDVLAKHLSVREGGGIDRAAEIALFLRDERALIDEAPGWRARHFERLQRKLTDLFRTAA